MTFVTLNGRVAEAGGAVARGEHQVMDAHRRLVTRVADEQDDILATIQLVPVDDPLHDRLFEQLIDLLVEGMFLDLRKDYLAGDLGRDDYVGALSDLADRCRQVGLLPLPSRHT